MHRNRPRLAAVLLLMTALSAPTAVQAAEEALSLGVFPRRNFAETSALFTPMAKHLEQRLGRKVNLVTSKNYETFRKAVADRRYDIVHSNQYHYIRSSHAYQAIAHIQESGKSTIFGVIYVNKDSGITSPAQLRGRTIIFGGGQDAMVSYIANVHQLLQAGLKKDDFKTLFAVNPPNAIVALRRQQADAAGVGEGVPGFPAVRDAVGSDGLTALTSSEPLLQLPFAVRRDMPPELRASIQTILVTLKDSEAGRQVLKSALLTGMGKAEDSDYEPHRRMAAKVFGASAKQ